MTTVPMINLKNSLAFKPFFKGYVKRQLAWNGFIEKIFEPFTKTHIPERDQSFSTVRAQNFLKNQHFLPPNTHTCVRIKG